MLLAPNWVWMMLPLGACVGSFLGVLVYRLPKKMSPWVGRSVCEVCAAPLQGRDMVPVLSFLWLRGRCRACGGRLRWELLVFEFLGAMLGVAAALLFPMPEPALCAAVLGWGLLALAWIDARHFILPDVLTLPLLAFGLGMTAWLRPDSLGDHAVGAVVGYVAFVGINVVYKKRRQRDGLGRGDAKLLALAGAWAGWQVLPWVVLGAALLGVVYVLVCSVVSGQKMSGSTRLPFGAFLAPVIFVAYVVQG